jgi:hypothetical protein
MQNLTALFLLTAVACGPGRTSPVTRPVPASYDASKNDPKALALVEKMTTALGGADKWTAAKQLSFTVEIELNGEVKAIYHHDWDRWNARHRFEHPTMDSIARAKEANDDKLVEQSVAMYKLFDRGRGAAFFGRKSKMKDGIYDNELDTANRKDATEKAFQRWTQDTYMISFPYRLTDPGVYVKHDGERTDDVCPAAKCEVIAVTFDPAVGEDKYWINVDAANAMPVLIEWEKKGSTGRIAYKVVDWQEAGGLKFPVALDNVGARNLGSSEVWRFKDAEVSSPDDVLYIPQVR